MVKAFSTLGLGIKMICLTAIATILLSSSVSTAIQGSYAQFGVQQEQEPQSGGEQQVESDGGLTATLNGDSFATGDTITISGTVQQRAPDSYVSIEVIDPQSNTVETAYPDVTADNTFTHTFIAGEQEDFDTDEPMETSGNYRIVATYFPPGDELESEEVELVFEYTATTDDEAESETAVGPTTIFQSTEDGVRIQVPNGWVVEDVNNTDPQVQQYTEQYGVEYLVIMCPENQALPVIGGLHTCTIESPTAVGVESFRFVDLSSRPEFAALARENRSITTSDLLALYIEYLRQTQNLETLQGLQIVEDTDVAVNIIDSQTNQTVGTAPAKYVELSHAQGFGTETFSEFALFVLHNDAGYVLRPLFISGLESDAEAPSFVRQVLDSFQLVVSPMNTTAASTIVPEPQNNATVATATPFSSNSSTSTNLNSATSPTPQQSEQEQQQEQQPQQFQPQNAGDSVSMGPGSSTKTTDAFSPNPIQVSVGSTVTWTNDDSVIHTVNSGTSPTESGLFSSPIMNPGDTFEYTFTEAGEVPYFCLLHPNMVGTANVS